jgi:hypothetical protein
MELRTIMMFGTFTNVVNAADGPEDKWHREAVNDGDSDSNVQSDRGDESDSG